MKAQPSFQWSTVFVCDWGGGLGIGIGIGTGIAYAYQKCRNRDFDFMQGRRSLRMDPNVLGGNLLVKARKKQWT